MKTIRFLSFIVAWSVLGSVFADEKAPAAPEAISARGHLLLVSFPLAEVDDRRLRLSIQQIIDRHDGAGRPVIVLEFVRKRGADQIEDPLKASALGSGTEFERSLSLSRWLIGPIGVRARTVAYLPDSIEGHAVLVAMACEEIAMAPLAEMGRIAIDEGSVDQVVTAGYLGIAERRAAFPPDAIRSMLDREASLFKVELVGDESQFVSSTSLEALRQAGRVLGETQLSIPGQLGKFTGQEMRSWRWITHLARDEAQLRELLAATTWNTQKPKGMEGKMRPALIEIRGAISSGSVNRWMRAIDEARNTDMTNLLILHIHSPGGNLSECLRLANYLANLDESIIETVAWVDGQALGDAALIGLACDNLLIKPDSILGGPSEATIDADSIRNLNATWQELAATTNRTEGEWYGLLCPELELHEYLHQAGRTEIGDVQLFSKRPDFNEWKEGRALSFPKGMLAEEAIERNWAASLAPNLPAVAEQWGLEKVPEPKRVSQIEQWIRSFADQEWLATLLLTLALILFTNELSTPGLGLAGFMSLLCISLFFWMKFLDGTVEWLEITLCLAGLLALGLEIFVLPGFGIFGFGGLVMLGTGIILASQTFIVPSNDYQWGKLATHTGQIAIACVALVTTIFMLRNQLERLPFFRMLRLEPPPAEKEILVSDEWANLIGSTGVTTSRCAPLGKALIRDRYWDVQSPDVLLDPETPIRVVEVRDRSIFVRRISRSDEVS